MPKNRVLCFCQDAACPPTDPSLPIEFFASRSFSRLAGMRRLCPKPPSCDASRIRDVLHQ